MLFLCSFNMVACRMEEAAFELLGVYHFSLWTQFPCPKSHGSAGTTLLQQRKYSDITPNLIVILKKKKLFHWYAGWQFQGGCINLFCFQIIGGCELIMSFLVKLSCAFWILNLTSSMMVSLDKLSIVCDVFHLIVYICHGMTWCIFRLRALVSFVFVHYSVFFW